MIKTLQRNVSLTQDSKVFRVAGCMGYIKTLIDPMRVLDQINEIVEAVK